MRIGSLALTLVLLGFCFSVGCSEKRGEQAKPLSEAERKKVDDDMRKMTEKNKK